MKFQVNITPSIYKVSYEKAEIRDTVKIDIDISTKELHEMMESPQNTIQGFGTELATFMTYTMKKMRKS